MNVGRPLVSRKVVSACFDTFEIVGVADAQHVPSVGQEARRDILGEGDARVAFDGDVVVVVDPAKVVELQVAGQRRRFRADAFHQAAVAADGVDVVIEDVEARLVEPIGQPLLADGHAHARRDALPERARRGFDSRDQVVLRMPRRVAADLAEVADVVERHRRLAQRARSRRSPPCVFVRCSTDHSSMEAWPFESTKRSRLGQIGSLRIEAHDPVPDGVDQRRQRHRRARMSGVGRLHGIDRERANRVDAQLDRVLRRSLLWQLAWYSYCFSLKRFDHL